jgi:hypothetical protein
MSRADDAQLDRDFAAAMLAGLRALPLPTQPLDEAALAARLAETPKESDHEPA